MESLNQEYESLIRNDLSIDDAYAKMVSSRPRRMLNKYDYNQGTALRSARCAEQPKESDVRNFYYRLEKKKPKIDIIYVFYLTISFHLYPLVQ